MIFLFLVDVAESRTTLAFGVAEFGLTGTATLTISLALTFTVAIAFFTFAFDLCAGGTLTRHFSESEELFERGVVRVLFVGRFR